MSLQEGDRSVELRALEGIVQPPRLRDRNILRGWTSWPTRPGSRS